MRLTLASGSPQRREILEKLGLDFEVVVPGVEELTAGDPEHLVVENARRKAAAVSADGMVIACDTDVVLDGEVLGNVISADGPDHLLIVSEHARIEGEVRCANLVVNGFIAGPVHASELLELQSKGRIFGDVHYKLLEMHGGATVTGTLTHQQTGEPVFHLAAVPDVSEA